MTLNVSEKKHKTDFNIFYYHSIVQVVKQKLFAKAQPEDHSSGDIMIAKLLCKHYFTKLVIKLLERK